MISKDRTRITISPRKEILSRIDDFAKETGMSRSDAIQFMVVQGFENYEAIRKIHSDAINKLAENVGAM